MLQKQSIFQSLNRAANVFWLTIIKFDSGSVVLWKADPIECEKLAKITVKFNKTTQFYWTTTIHKNCCCSKAALKQKNFAGCYEQPFNLQKILRLFGKEEILRPKNVEFQIKQISGLKEVFARIQTPKNK